VRDILEENRYYHRAWIAPLLERLSHSITKHHFEDLPRIQKALTIVTSHAKFDDPKADPTGLWLSELTHFCGVFEEAGMHMDIVSPNVRKWHWFCVS